MFKLLFSFQGRIGRAGFWVGSLAMGLILGLMMGVLGVVFWTLKTSGPDIAPNYQMLAAEFTIGWLLTIGLFYLVSIYVSLVLIVKRLHDLGQSAWALLWLVCAYAIAAAIHPALLMVVGFGWSIYLGFIRGTDGMNAYGPVPAGLTNTGTSEYERTLKQISAMEAKVERSAPVRRRAASQGGFGQRRAT